MRCEQLDLLLRWGSEFRQSSSQTPEGEKVLEDLVAFDVILGDLNFDNCSSGSRPSGPQQETAEIGSDALQMENESFNTASGNVSAV